MHHNYCFRHKQYSYATCDAALAASLVYFSILDNKTGFEVSECDVMSYCMYPDVFVEYAQFKEEFGPVTGLPTRAFLVGPDIGEEFEIEIEQGKTLHLKIIAVGDVNKDGNREVFCEVNGQMRTFFIEDKSETEVSTILSYFASFMSKINGTIISCLLKKSKHLLFILRSL